MIKFINTIPKCDICTGELVLTSIQVDLLNCMFILFCECIVCGEDQTILLQLTDFIELSKFAGGQDEKSN